MDSLNTAQTIILDYYGKGDLHAPNHPPHKPQGTAAEPHWKRAKWDKLKFSARLGSRPPVFGGRV